LAIQLQRLNRTDVGAQERVIAERFYLAQNAAAWWDAKEAAGADSIAAFEAEHPTFRELVEVHGEPDRPKAEVVRAWPCACCANISLRLNFFC